MVELSKQAKGEELKEARTQMAAKLLDLARDCDKAKTDNRRPRDCRYRESQRIRIRNKRVPVVGERKTFSAL